MAILLVGADIRWISDPTGAGVGVIFPTMGQTLTRPVNWLVWAWVTFFTHG
jgi:NhaP-type Na+/H+ or K+/H+ antiporter